LFTRPAPRLLEKRELEVVEANGAQRGAAEIEHLVTLRWTLAGEKVRLVVAVEMILVSPIAELHALEQLIGDVGTGGSGHQGGEPVEAGDDSVLDGARLDHARPADHARHAETALADGAFGVLERRHAAVRPSEHLRAVVSG